MPDQPAGYITLRHTLRPGDVIGCTPTEWRDFLAEIKTGAHDNPSEETH